MEKEYKPSTIVLYAESLRTLYRHFLQRDGLSDEDAKSKTNALFRCIPIKDLRKEAKRDTNYRDKLVTPEEFKALVMEAKSPRIKALLTTLLESGARRGEILSLKIRDVTFGDKYTSLRVKGKTGERTIPLLKSVPYLRQWLTVHPHRYPDSPLFATVRKGEIRQIAGSSVTACLRRLCKKAGIRHIHPHALRHSRLTELAKLGLSEYAMKVFAGWTMNSRMSARYIHLSGRESIEAVLAIEGVSTEETRRERIPLIKMVNCPNCDGVVGGDQIFCPSCGQLLDERIQIEKVIEVKALREEVDDLRRLLKRTLDIAIGTPPPRINATK